MNAVNAFNFGVITARFYRLPTEQISTPIMNYDPCMVEDLNTCRLDKIPRRQFSPSSDCRMTDGLQLRYICRQSLAASSLTSMNELEYLLGSLDNQCPCYRSPALTIEISLKRSNKQYLNSIAE